MPCIDSSYTHKLCAFKDIALAQKLVNTSYEYNLDDTLKATFHITQSNVDMMRHYEPIEFQGEHWMHVSCIYWGQGYSSNLYWNGGQRLIAINDLLCSTSIVQKEYEALL